MLVENRISSALMCKILHLRLHKTSRNLKIRFLITLILNFNLFFIFVAYLIRFNGLILYYILTKTLYIKLLCFFKMI